jgi:parallel beta-helix repeat protein
MKAILVVTLLFSLLVGTVFVGTVNANPSSYETLPKIKITSDGSITPQDSPITQFGNTYTLTGDIISKSLDIQKDNIVIDGAGHKLQDSNQEWYIFGTGLNILRHSNIRIKDITVLNYNNGVSIIESSNVIVTNSTIINSGVFLTYCKDCKIEDSTFSQNHIAILVAASSNINITKNQLKENNQGIDLESSPGTNNLVNILENDIDSKIISPLSDPVGGSGTAISISGASNVLVANNNIKDANYGVKLNYCKNGITIFNNSFISNEVSFSQKLSQPCTFNNSNKGNFWSEYNGTDSNNDGICDTPYKLDVNNTDYYPLVKSSNVASSNSMNSTISPQAAEVNPNLPIIIVSAIVIATVIVSSLSALLYRRRKRQG